MEQLSPATFLAGVELIQQQLRVKRDDRWSETVCKLKFHSFQSEFPEVNDAQFFWACERWVQTHSAKDYARFPVWDELMTALYAVENGKANRSWGSNESYQLLSPQLLSKKGCCRASSINCWRRRPAQRRCLRPFRD